MSATLFAEVKHALVAAVPRRHSRLELGVLALAAICLILAHAHPRLFYVVIQLEFVKMHPHSEPVAAAKVGSISGGAWCYRLRDNCGA